MNAYLYVRMDVFRTHSPKIRQLAMDIYLFQLWTDTQGNNRDYLWGWNCKCLMLLYAEVYFLIFLK